jgi:hypothetical protein
MRRNTSSVLFSICITVASFSCSASAHLHPTLGRFVQRDPLAYPDGLSLYVYQRAASLSLSDPSGLAACKCCSVSLTFEPAGQNGGPKEWTEYTYEQRNRIGFKIKSVASVQGDASKCKYFWDESGTLTWEPGDGALGNPQNWNPRPEPVEGQEGNQIGRTHTDPLGWALPPMTGSFGARLNNFTVQVRCISSDGSVVKSPKWTINGNVTVNVPVANQPATLNPNVLQSVKG